jgi:hypothetical protein
MCAVRKPIRGIFLPALLAVLCGCPSAVPAPALQISLVRLTIGASDFSPAPYSLDDMPDGETHPALAHFSYVDAMQAQGIPIYALTPQNEPHFDTPNYPGMLASTRILEWDHNWDRPQEPLQVLGNPPAAGYVAGVAWHCYAGNVAAQTRAWARGVLLWNLALDQSAGRTWAAAPSVVGWSRSIRAPGKWRARRLLRDCARQPVRTPGRADEPDSTVGAMPRSRIPIHHAW